MFRHLIGVEVLYWRSSKNVPGGDAFILPTWSALGEACGGEFICRGIVGGTLTTTGGCVALQYAYNKKKTNTMLNYNCNFFTPSYFSSIWENMLKRFLSKNKLWLWESNTLS